MSFLKSLHPYQVCFCGYSGSGKTTLISRLLRSMSEKYSIGYMKTDAHRFSIDTPGKDTYIAWTSGAKQVAIADRSHSALVSSGQDIMEFQDNFVDCDMVFIEGRKQSDFKKIVVVDKDHKILEKVHDKTVNNILAFVGCEYKSSLLGKPYFNRDNVEDIRDFIEKMNLDNIPRLYGLVLAGGFSKRMKQDKALIDYYGKPQVQHCFELLSNFCDKTFISARHGQLPESVSLLPQIHDRFLKFGPVGGILTAMIEVPKAAWFVVACDLPLLTKKTLDKIVSHRNPFRLATHYCANNDERFPEPLCTIYEPKIRHVFLKRLGQEVFCPRKTLKSSPCQIVTMDDENDLKNVNYSHEYLEFKEGMDGGFSI
ncbi:MAG: bifunctional molybdenum cofactor guanylyltransferase MobA/molybdopterin-guanine dinucleotide biosynthesis adaptor protein MobB [Oligoflexales bacterium]